MSSGGLSMPASHLAAACSSWTLVTNRHRQPWTAGCQNPQATVLGRTLNDGRRFQIYKVFYDPTDLTERLRELGWHFDIQLTSQYSSTVLDTDRFSRRSQYRTG